MTHVVIIGGGLAGGTAAEALRERGHDGEITLVAAEAHPPYQRPPLSKGYLVGDEGRDAVILHPTDWYAEHDIVLREGTTAVGLDTDARRVSLEGGEELPFDALLLATGASPRRLAVPGADLDGVHVLRTLDQSDALAAQLREGGRRVVVVGAGWIGMEVAAAARTLGNEVTVLSLEEMPLATALGRRMGRVFLQLHRDHGVEVRTGVSADEIIGVERATGVVAGGERFDADLVVVGVGATPNTVLAEQAGLRLLGGVLTDAGLRTSAPGVFAAGDVANPYHPVLQRHLRSEHWATALAAGTVAARSMLGDRAALNDIPYFYTDQYDLGMELSGYAPLMSDADLVVRGDLEAREFIAFWVDHGRVVGGMNVNVWDVGEAVQALIRSGERVDAGALQDAGVPLQDLLP